MARYIGIHTLPGFTRELRAGATPVLGTIHRPRFLKAYSSLWDAKAVCERDADDQDSVSQVRADLGLPSDQIVKVEAVSDFGSLGLDTHFV